MTEGWSRGQTETLFIDISAVKRFVDVGLIQVLRLKNTSLVGQRLVVVPKGRMSRTEWLTLGTFYLTFILMIGIISKRKDNLEHN